MSLGLCFGIVAPYYNMVLVFIVIALFLRLFRQPAGKKFYMKPWKIVFCAVLFYVVEESLTIIASEGYLHVSSLIFPLIEMVIIFLFTYALLLQKRYEQHG